MEDYFKLRDDLIRNDSISLGLSQPSELEVLANTKLNLLREEFSSRFSIDDMLDFWAIKDRVISTRLFQTLKKMPKGSVLHLHYGGTLPAAEIMPLIRNDSEIYVKVNGSQITTYGSYQENATPLPEFLLNPENEQLLIAAMEMNREKSFGLPSQRWTYFEGIFTAMLIHTYTEKRIYEKYLNVFFTKFYEENAQRIECRFMPFAMTDRGQIIPFDDEIDFIKEVCDKFSLAHPDFSSGAILSSHKAFSKERIIYEGEEIYRLHLKYPKFVLGFDILGEEETYKEDEEIYAAIHAIRQKAKENGNNYPMFIHAGEVVSKPAPIIYDAFALETKRLAHGISLIKHPHLMEIAKEKKITIEACPISNMLLGYVRDPRVHPALAYLFQGLPVTISSDDPGLFGYCGVTHDWVWIYVLWGIDLMHLKKLVEYSIDGCTEPEEVRRAWEPKWQEFIQYLANLEI